MRNILTAINESLEPNKSSKDNKNKTDKRLSNFSEKYKGYRISIDSKFGCYNIYDEHGELEDSGFLSKEQAKKAIDELVYSLKNKPLKESSKINEAKTYQKELFDLKKYLLGSRGWSYDLKITKSDDNFYRIDGTGFDNSQALFNSLKYALKKIGAKYIKPGGKYYEFITFYLDDNTLNNFVNKYNQEQDDMEKAYLDNLSKLDINKYKPNEKILQKLAEYRNKGSMVNVKAIKNEDKLLTYYYAAVLMNWKDLMNTIKSANILGLDSNADIFKAIYEFVEKDDNLKDSRTEEDIYLDLPNTNGMIKIIPRKSNGKPYTWMPVKFFKILLDNGISIRLNKHTGAGEYDYNGLQWSEKELFTFNPDTPYEFDYTIVIHTSEGGGGNRYTGNGTKERGSFQELIDDILRRNNRIRQEKDLSTNNESYLKEDTVKTKNGKWVNKGKEGTHGTFRTKKAADAQRKAMFARGYSTNEAIENKLEGNTMYESLKTKPISTEKFNELKTELQKTLYKLFDKQIANLKTYEIEFQDTIEKVFPSEPWWNITSLNIFGDLFENKNPSETVEKILDNIKVDVKESYDETGDTYFYNDNGNKYKELDRSKDGTNALLYYKSPNSDFEQWIIAWNCPKGRGSWGQGHYYQDYKSAWKDWQNKYYDSEEYGDEDFEVSDEEVWGESFNKKSHFKKIDESIEDIKEFYPSLLKDLDIVIDEFIDNAMNDYGLDYEQIEDIIIDYVENWGSNR